MKNLLVVLCLIFTTHTYANDLPDTIQDVLPSVVVIEAQPKMLTSIVDKIFESTAVRSGTGFFISENEILTSYHIIEDTESIYVSLYNKDGIQHKADVIGYDKFLDIALLRVEIKGWPVEWASCTPIRVGDDVIAIGNPFGYKFSVSKGIVSHKDRRDPEYSFVRYLQTDVAVNKGNSGGPLFNIKGQAIGIVQAIISIAGGSNGISLAVESDLVLDSIWRIRETKGEVKRPSIGLGVEKYWAEHHILYAKEYGNRKGLIIRGIAEGSAAEKAGLLGGDLILSMQGVKVTEVYEFIDFLQTFSPGDEVTLKIFRLNKELDIEVTLGTIGN